MFTPFVGVPMQSALDLCVAWSVYGLYMCQNFWPRLWSNLEQVGSAVSVTWPRQSHPQALTPEGKKRTPWPTSWARATFEQGILSVLPLLEGPCTATSLPGELLFQASALPTDRMRPAIFHGFGKAKIGAQQALRRLEKQGWETPPSRGGESALLLQLFAAVTPTRAKWVRCLRVPTPCKHLDETGEAPLP